MQNIIMRMKIRNATDKNKQAIKGTQPSITNEESV